MGWGGMWGGRIFEKYIRNKLISREMEVYLKLVFFKLIMLEEYFYIRSREAMRLVYSDVKS